MTAGFALILVALNIGVPVRCYEDAQAWKQVKVEVQASPAIAYYLPNGEHSYIALGPMVCKDVRKARWEGAYVLAHEIGHYKDDLRGTLTHKIKDEDEANEYANRHVDSLHKRLQRHYKIKPQLPVLLTPDNPPKP